MVAQACGMGSCANDSLAAAFWSNEDYEDVIILLRTSQLPEAHIKNLFRDWGHCLGMRFSFWDYYALTGSPPPVNLSVQERDRVRARFLGVFSSMADLASMPDLLSFEQPDYGFPHKGGP